MTGDEMVALLAFLFPLAYSPGPGNAFFAAIGASMGLRAALPALAGYHVATLLVTVAVGAGMGASVLRHPATATVLAAAGSGYVLWLGWVFLRSARSPTGSALDHSLPARRIGFRSGVVMLLVNPKAYYIIAVMFTQFLRPPHTGIASVLLVAVIFTLNNVVAFTVWTLAGRGLTILFRDASSQRWIGYGFAATLFAVAVWMVVPLFT